jgi:hypothetical protein
MTRIRRNIFKILMILALFALPGSDVECEDGEFEFDWPDIGYDHEDYWDGGYWVATPVYVEPAPCCWYW